MPSIRFGEKPIETNGGVPLAYGRLRRLIRVIVRKVGGIKNFVCFWKIQFDTIYVLEEQEKLGGKG